jgi:hypothetical protein
MCKVSRHSTAGLRPLTDARTLVLSMNTARSCGSARTCCSGPSRRSERVQRRNRTKPYEGGVPVARFGGQVAPTEPSSLALPGSGLGFAVFTGRRRVYKRPRLKPVPARDRSHAPSLRLLSQSGQLRGRGSGSVSQQSANDLLSTRPSAANCARPLSRL